MTTPQGHRRRRPSQRDITARVRYLSRFIPPELAQRMAPHMAIRDRRTQAIVRAMDRRVNERLMELISESEWDNDIQMYVHPILGPIDRQEAIYDTTARIERAIYTGEDDYDIEPELHAIFSP